MHLAIGGQHARGPVFKADFTHADSLGSIPGDGRIKTEHPPPSPLVSKIDFQ